MKKQTSFTEKLEATPTLYEEVKQAIGEIPDSEIIADLRAANEKERANAMQFLDKLANFKVLNELKIDSYHKRRIGKKYAKKWLGRLERKFAAISAS